MCFNFLFWYHQTEVFCSRLYSMVRISYWPMPTLHHYGFRDTHKRVKNNEHKKRKTHTSYTEWFSYLKYLTGCARAENRPEAVRITSEISAEWVKQWDSGKGWVERFRNICFCLHYWFSTKSQKDQLATREQKCKTTLNTSHCFLKSSFSLFTALTRPMLQHILTG